jgi:hypothetical protein
MGWIYVAQDMDVWQALVIMVMNLQVAESAGNSLTSQWTTSFSSRLCCVELIGWLLACLLA